MVPAPNARARRADLHTHTWYSDGTQSPQQLVEMAKAAEVRLLAVTDHETAAGVGEAVAAGLAAGVEVVPGIEISTRLKKVEVHVLGLWIDPDDARLGALIESRQRDRRERARKMVDKLCGLGVAIDFEDVLAATGKGSIGRPHLALALVAVGAVATFQEAFSRYVGKNAPAYVGRRHLDPEEAIVVIHGAGGVAVMAHGLAGGPQREHVAKIAAMGIDGLEVVHPKLNQDQSKWLMDFAKREGLATSGGSDWHGDGMSAGELGEYLATPAMVEGLKARLAW